MSRPRPAVSSLTQPFWDATAQGRFLFQRCQNCSAAIFYPRPSCTSCGSLELAWEQASGLGVIHTFSIARRATHPAMKDLVPYIVAIVELAEGPHVTTNIVGCPVDDVAVGQAVELAFDDIAEDGYALPLFRLVG